ncbi:MAG: Na/Pi cotransporter family protein [Caldilineaceae bacterium]|nr:Na/Pi cotransporter family protein [Caldilineaceae bacterium]
MMKNVQRRMFVLLLLGLLVSLPRALYAAGEGGAEIHLPTMTSGLLGGLAIFLFGMEQMSEAMRIVAGLRMRDVLSRLTSNRWAGLLTGSVVTAVVQSSSVTTVMVVGFITAGLMTFSQALGIILGANIGTTLTVQIIAFKVTQYALLLVAIGFILLFTGKGKRKWYGQWLMGLGLLFVGMDLMGSSMAPLRDYPPFIRLMAATGNPLFGILAAATFTALVQASSATIGLAIVFASQGLVPLETGIAFVLGANVGTCITAGLAAIGKPREAVRASAAHILFNIVGALIVLPFLQPFTELIRTLSPLATSGVSVAVAQAAVVPRQIANAHTLFNVTISMLFLPFVPWIERIIDILVPDKAYVDDPKMIKPRYLDESLLGTASLALGLARREVSRIGDILEQMMAKVPAAVFQGDLEAVAEIRAMDDQVDALYTAVTQYLAKIGQKNLSDDVANAVLGAMSALTELEAIGDIMENNLAHLAQVNAGGTIQITPESMVELNGLHRQVTRSLTSALTAFLTESRDAAEEVMNMKDAINHTEMRIRAWKARRLQETLTPAKIASYTMQVDTLENLKRIYYHAKRVAKLVVREEGAADWVQADNGTPVAAD